MTIPERAIASVFRRYDSSPNVSTPVYRIEVRRAANVAFAERPVFGCQLTLSAQWPVKTEFLLQPGHTLGWLDHNHLDHLRLKPHYPTHDNLPPSLASLFCSDDGCLRSTTPLAVYLLSNDVETLKTHGVLLFSHPL